MTVVECGSGSDETDEEGQFVIPGMPQGTMVKVRAKCVSPTFEVTPLIGEEVVDEKEDYPEQSFDLNLNPSPGELTTSQINAFVWMEKSRQFAQYLYTMAGLDVLPRHSRLDVNKDCLCDSSYNCNDLHMGFCKARGGCFNAAYSTFVAHEFGHNFTREIHIGSAEEPGPPPSFGWYGIAEGTADVFAAYLTLQPILGQDYKEGEPWRRNLSLPKVFPTESDDKYEVGLTLGSSFWQLLLLLQDRYREEVGSEVLGTYHARSLFTRFVKETFYLKDGVPEIDETVGETLVEIDDKTNGDSNPGNGSPHQEQIRDAFLPQNLYRLPFIRGDVNGDGEVDIADPIELLEYLFDTVESLPSYDAGDVQDDNGLDMADPIYLLNYLFHGGDPPASPFPDCGKDSPSHFPFEKDFLTCSQAICPE